MPDVLEDNRAVGNTDLREMQDREEEYHACTSVDAATSNGAYLSGEVVRQEKYVMSASRGDAATKMKNLIK